MVQEELTSKISSMSGDERKEHWRNQTLINRVRDNSVIATEYFALITFIREKYNGRIEAIQNPYLHLISHYLELVYKVVIEEAIDNSYIDAKKADFIHNHSLGDLKPYLFEILDKISAEELDSTKDKEYFVECQNDHDRLIQILQTNVTTYRYSHKVDKNGNNTAAGHPFSKDYDSPNMLDVIELLNKCCTSIVAIRDIFSHLFERQ